MIKFLRREAILFIPSVMLSLLGLVRKPGGVGDNKEPSGYIVHSIHCPNCGASLTEWRAIDKEKLRETVEKYLRGNVRFISRG